MSSRISEVETSLQSIIDRLDAQRQKLAKHAAKQSDHVKKLEAENAELRVKLRRFENEKYRMD